MEYLVLPAIYVIGSCYVAVSLLAVRRALLSSKVFFAFVALCLSHGVLGLTVYVIKEIDSNSYMAASTQLLLNETLTAVRNKEPGFDDRLERFVTKQHLTYENRGNLLENARSFAEEGRRLREVPK